MKIRNGILESASFYEAYGTVTVPDGVTAIGNGAFAGNPAITGIVFPPTLTDIGRHAFAGCVGLKEVSIPPTVVLVGGGAFADCRSLTSVSYDPQTTSFQRGAFAGCGALSRLTVGDLDYKVFPDPKDSVFGVARKKADLEDGITTYVGKFVGDGFPEFDPNVDMFTTFAVAKDAEGREYRWHSTFEADAIEGAWLQARHETIATHFGRLGPDSILTPRQVALLCGLCAGGVGRFCDAMGIAPNEGITVREILGATARYLPGVNRRLRFALAHQDEIDDLQYPEHQLGEGEIESRTKLPTETRSAD